MRRSVSCLLLLAALIGCEGEEDLPEVTTAWQAHPPTFQVGGMDDRPDYQLFRVAGATRLSDGRVAIANSGTSQIRFYAEDGTHLGDVGGEGDGPGEFRYISKLTRLAGDTLLVTSRNPGLTWLDPQGQLIRSVRITPWAVRLPCRINESSSTTLSDGSLVSVYHDNFYGADCPPTPPNPWRETALITHVDPIEEVLDSIALIPGVERNSPNYRAYGKIPLVAVSFDAVYAMDSGAAEILKLSFAGDTLAILPTPFEARLIPDSAKTQTVREFERNGVVERGNPYLYPDRFPAAGRIVAGPNDELWVMAYPDVAEPVSSTSFSHPLVQRGDPGGGHWRVLNREGAVIGEVRTPPGFFPLEIGSDYVLGVTRNELDVEEVTLLELTRN